ncbi:MAG: protein-L-isoaspartate(D-aspartate) O-methyltransferase [Hansschlegelia sp.]
MSGFDLADPVLDDRERTRRAELVLSLRSRGVLHTRTLKAIETIPRALFTPSRLRDVAYVDRALPIACGQTLEAPSTIATMLDALGVGDLDTVLEIGCGSGYVTAILSRLARRVVAVERFRTLAENAERRLVELGGADGVTIHVGDGALGWPSPSPYERILVSAAVKAPPSALLNQLKSGGTMLVPIGDVAGQRLTRIVKNKDGSLDESTIGVARAQPMMAGVAAGL